MRRKAIQMSNNTLLVSLPASYVKRFSISKGQELEVVERDGFVEVRAEPFSERRTSTSLCGCCDIHSAVCNIYACGFDEAEIVASGNLCPAEVHSSLGNIFGFEIFREGERSLTLKKTHEVDYSEVDGMINRLFHVLKQMGSCERRVCEEYARTAIRIISSCERALLRYGQYEHKKSVILGRMLLIFRVIVDTLVHSRERSLCPSIMDLLRAAYSKKEASIILDDGCDWPVMHSLARTIEQFSLIQNLAGG